MQVSLFGFRRKLIRKVIVTKLNKSSQIKTKTEELKLFNAARNELIIPNKQRFWGQISCWQLGLG